MAMVYMDVSKNSGTPESSILIGFSMINHPFWDTPTFGNIHIYIYIYKSTYNRDGKHGHFHVCHQSYPEKDPNSRYDLYHWMSTV